MEKKIKTKKSFIFPIILVLIVILILVGYWWKKKRIGPIPIPPSEKPAEKIMPKEDSVAAISQDLDSLEILNLDREFSDIDQDLNSL